MRLHPDRPLIYLITAGTATDENIKSVRPQIVDIVQTAVEYGVSMVQLREKQLSIRSLYELALDLVRLTRHSSTKLLINDRADIAVAAGADGVHLTSSSLSTDRVRSVFGEELVVGVSTHSGEEVMRAATSGADFAVLGPVFDTPNKLNCIGAKRFAEICSGAGEFPVLGLGGIDELNYKSVIEAGASGFAAIRSLNEQKTMAKLMSSICTSND